MVHGILQPPTRPVGFKYEHPFFLDSVANSLTIAQVSVNTTFSLQWKISLSEEDLNQTTAWVFRFLPHGTSATDSQLANDSISSPGLNIVQPGLPVTSTTSLRSTSTQVSSTIPATADANSATATTVSLATPIPSSAGLSTGAKAGIGIGASLGGVALIAIGFFVALRVRKRPVEDSGANLIKHSEGEHGDLVHEIDQGVASMVPRNKPLVSSTFYRSKSSKMGSELSSDTAAAELP